MRLGMMFSENVATEVAIEVSPNGVNVIGSVLGAVVLEEKLGRLDAIIVAFSRATTPGPGEVGFLRVYERGFTCHLGKCFGAMLGGVNLYYVG